MDKDDLLVVHLENSGSPKQKYSMVGPVKRFGNTYLFAGLYE